MGFTDSFNSSLRTGALIQGIFMRQEERDLARRERRADEYVRGLDAAANKYGSENPKDWGEEGQAFLRDHMNNYPELAGERPGGTPRFMGIIPMGDGVAADVEVDDGKGNVSRGPITKRGSTDDDDEVVIVNNINQLKDPIFANLERSKFTARVRSEKAHARISGRENQRDTEDALEILNGRLDGGGETAEAPVQVPAPEDTPPIVEEGPAKGLRSASAGNPSAAVTSPATGIPSFEEAAPAVAGLPNGQFSGGAFKTEGAEQLVRAAAANNGVDPELAAAVSFHESAGGDANAQSHTGASGLMQITQPALDDVNRVHGTDYTREQMRTDPEANADVGTKYLKMMLDQHDGNVEQALAAYNGGAGHLRQAGGDISKTRPETAAYPGKVLAFLSGSSDAQAAAPSAEGKVQGTQDEAPGTQDRIVELQNIVDAPAASTRAGRRRQRKEKAVARKELAALEQQATADPSTEIANFDPADAAEEKVVAEVKETELPTSDEELVKVVDTIKKTKPAKKWSEKERKALYTLHRLNPAQFPLQDVVSALKTGRMTKTNWKTYTNAADQVVQVDENGNQRVLPDTPEAIAIRDAKLRKANADADYTEAQRTGQLQTNKLAQTKARTDFFLEQSVNLHGDDPQKKAQLRDQFNVTADVMGLDMDAQGTATAVNKAALLQADLEEETGSGILNLWTGPNYVFSDFSAGLTILNAPGNPYNLDDPNEEVREDGAEWVKENYFDPVKQQFPKMEPNKQSHAAYAATHLVKEYNMDRADAIRVAGTIASNARFQNAGQMIKAMDLRIAQQGK